MKIYNYSQLTKEFLSSDNAFESPLEPGVYLVPAFATLLEPPEASEGVAHLWDSETESWTSVVDKRGTVYWLPGDKQEHTMYEFGDLPVGAMLTQPAETLAEAAAVQKSLISIACRDKLTAGFPSNALGTTHNYPSSPTDQLNLNSTVLLSLNQSPEWSAMVMCEDSRGVWRALAHNAQQVQQVGSDWNAFREAQLERKRELDARIEAATTIASIKSIVW